MITNDQASFMYALTLSQCMKFQASRWLSSGSLPPHRGMGGFNHTTPKYNPQPASKQSLHTHTHTHTLTTSSSHNENIG